MRRSTEADSDSVIDRPMGRLSVHVYTDECSIELGTLKQNSLLSFTAVGMRW
jgi:hypothetical protein